MIYVLAGFLMNELINHLVPYAIWALFQPHVYVIFDEYMSTQTVRLQFFHYIFLINH